MRIDFHVFLHDGDPDHLRLILKGQEKIMTKLDDANASLDQLQSDFTEFGATVAAFIASDEENFRKLTELLAQQTNLDPQIDALIMKINAARAALATEKDKIVTADAADNLPTP